MKEKAVNHENQRKREDLELLKQYTPLPSIPKQEESLKSPRVPLHCKPDTFIQALPLARSAVPFPFQVLRRSFNEVSGMASNPAASFLTQKQEQGILANLEKKAKLKKQNRIREARRNPEIDYKILRPLSRDPFFISGLSTYLEFLQNAENGDTKENLGVISTVSKDNNASEAEVKKQELEKSASFLQIRDFLDNHHFKPRKIQTPVVRCKEYILGHPLLQEDEDDEDIDVIDFGRRLHDCQSTCLNDSKTVCGKPPAPDLKKIKKKPLPLNPAIKPSNTDDVIKPAITVKPPIGTNWRQTFEAANSAMRKGLEESLVERTRQCLEACENATSYQCVIDMKDVYKGMESSSQRKHYVPAWNGLLPHIWVKDRKSAVLQSKKNAELQKFQLQGKSRTREPRGKNAFDKFIIEIEKSAAEKVVVDSATSLESNSESQMTSVFVGVRNNRAVAHRVAFLYENIL